MASRHATNAPRTALIAGATGLVGRHCLDELLASPRYDRVTAIGRRSLERSHPKLKDVLVDMGQLAELGERLRADDVFCCLGTTMRRAGSREAFRQVDYEYPLALARAALAQGATRYALVSSLGASARSRVFYNRVKGEVEEAVGALGYPMFVVLRPSLLLGERDEGRLGEDVAQRLTSLIAPLLVGPLERYRPIAARDVARAMVAIMGRGPSGRHIVESEQIRREAAAAPSAD